MMFSVLQSDKGESRQTQTALQEILVSCKEKIFSCDGGQTRKQVVERGSEIFMPGHMQNSSGNGNRI